MTFGEKLYELRKEKSISQEQFAEVMKVSRQAVSKWELSQTYPEMDKLIEISNYFEVTLDFLIKDENHNLQDKTHVSEGYYLDKVSNNGFLDMYKMIILTALAIALTSIRFFILGDFKVGIVLAVVSCIFIIGFYITRSLRSKI